MFDLIDHDQIQSLHAEYESSRQAGLAAEGWFILFYSERTVQAVDAASAQTRESANKAIQLAKFEHTSEKTRESILQAKKMAHELVAETQRAVVLWKHAHKVARENLQQKEQHLRKLEHELVQTRDPDRELILRCAVSAAAALTSNCSRGLEKIERALDLTTRAYDVASSFEIRSREPELAKEPERQQERRQPLERERNQPRERLREPEPEREWWQRSADRDLGRDSWGGR